MSSDTFDLTLIWKLLSEDATPETSKYSGKFKAYVSFMDLDEIIALHQAYWEVFNTIDHSSNAHSTRKHGFILEAYALSLITSRKAILLTQEIRGITQENSLAKARLAMKVFPEPPSPNTIILMRQGAEIPENDPRFTLALNLVGLLRLPRWHRESLFPLLEELGHL